MREPSAPTPRRIRSWTGRLPRRHNGQWRWGADFLLDTYTHYHPLRGCTLREVPIGPLKARWLEAASNEQELAMLAGWRPRASCLVLQPRRVILREAAIVVTGADLRKFERNASLLPLSPNLPALDGRPIEQQLVCVFCPPPLADEARARGIKLVPFWPKWARGRWPAPPASPELPRPPQH